jgi:hypothetical protein
MKFLTFSFILLAIYCIVPKETVRRHLESRSFADARKAKALKHLDDLQKSFQDASRLIEIYRDMISNEVIKP